jgi:aldose sugar dehydrogenase
MKQGHTRSRTLTVLVFCACLGVPLGAWALQVQTLVKGLNHPWSMVALPNGEWLVTEREGQLRRVDREFRLDPKPVEGLPSDIDVGGQGGLFDIALHPDHARNGWIYLSYAQAQKGGAATALARARIQGQRLVDWQHLFTMKPASRGGRHFGGRVVFDRQGYVYLTLGDRGDQDRAQQARDHAGSVIRLHDDGRVPSDNPFVNNASQRPESFSRGHRNIQGAAIHPRTGELWTHEHGPQGGDEVNITRSGRNYGWPKVTHGVNYVTGTRIGVGTHQAGVEPPLHVWTPSIAPSGMAFYEGQAFPDWRGSLLVGSLRGQALMRLVLEGNRVVREERVLHQTVGRIRDVRVGSDGWVYLLTDSPDGEMVRLKPS